LGILFDFPFRFFRRPNLSDWAALAMQALGAGYSEEQIVDAAFGHSWGRSGSESAMWNEWYERFNDLMSHEDGRIRRAGEIGRHVAAQERDAALEREHVESVRGW
jgi:LPS sulfotransferase NodH